MDSWAAKWKEKSEKTLVLGDGLKVTITRPTAWTLTQVGLPPIVFDVTKPEQHREEALKTHLKELQEGDVQAMAGFLKGILAACMSKPRLWLGEPVDCPDDQVTFQHLGGHAESIFLACWDFFDLEALKGVAANAATFRNKSTGEDGGQGGQEVQGDPQPASEAGP